MAWTAFYARETGDRDRIPDLKAYLRRETKSTEEYFARLVVLDALVTLRARTTAEDLRVVAKDSWLAIPAVVVLAVKWGDDEARLAVFDALDGRDDSDSKPWLAMMNGVASRRQNGVALRLLNGFETRLFLFISDRPDPDREYRPPGGSVPGDGRCRVPPGIPPFSTHQLWHADEPGEVPLSPGWQPIHTRRSPGHEAGTRIWYGSAGGVDRSEVRRRWIATLLDTEETGLPLARNVTRSVGYPSEKVLLRRVGRIREEIGDGYRAVAGRLRAAGLMTAEEVELVRPRIRLRVFDERSRKDRPVPDLDPKPAPAKPKRSGPPELR